MQAAWYNQDGDECGISYKFRLYPNRTQESQILRTFGCCRFVWNYYLAKRKEIYEQSGETLNYNASSIDMTHLKKSLEWLREVDATALQSSLRDLDTAFQNFFRRVKRGEKPGYPRFKSRKDRRQSYKSKCVRTNIKVLGNAVQLPKLGLVKCRVSKEVKGRILSATVSQNPSGKYFVTLCCTDVEIEPLPSTGAVVGLDMGLKAFAITSDGVEYPNHKFLTKSTRTWEYHAPRLSSALFCCSVFTSYGHEIVLSCLLGKGLFYGCRLALLYSEISLIPISYRIPRKI